MSKYVNTDKSDFDKFVATATWKKATTMPEIPHEYTLIRDTFNPKRFRGVCKFIKENGKPEDFKGKTYNYVVSNGYKYWIMVDEPLEAILINRAVA